MIFHTVKIMINHFTIQVSISKFSWSSVTNLDFRSFFWPTSEQKSKEISELQSGLDEVDACMGYFFQIRKMDLEARSLQLGVKAMLLAKLREYKYDLTKLKREVKKLASAKSSQTTHDELLDSGMANASHMIMFLAFRCRRFQNVWECSHNQVQRLCFCHPPWTLITLLSGKGSRIGAEFLNSRWLFRSK
ncbi:uncharacterized protein [Rutidosis leptorrhynchoides]|uniref:uncharacterized protein n=1 Tax=Rutidosis leptorrhynchoides TaxID=125765 RepID=UPI003A98F3E9